MVKSAQALRSGASMTQDAQSAPRRQRSAQPSLTPAAVVGANRPLQHLQSLVNSSPRVMQLRGWDKISLEAYQRNFLENKIMDHETSLPAGTELTDVEQPKSKQILGEIRRLQVKLAKHCQRYGIPYVAPPPEG